MHNNVEAAAFLHIITEIGLLRVCMGRSYDCTELCQHKSCFRPQRLTVPCRAQPPPLPLVCSADASAAFASISSLHIGIQSLLTAGFSFLFSHAFGLHAHCDREAKRGRKNASFDCCGTLKDCSCCHPQLVSALPNHSGRASTDGGIWCNIMLHRQRLGAQAWGRQCSIKHSRCRLFP